MRVLLPTGMIAEKVVRKASTGYDVDVVVIGKIASFLTPERLCAVAQGGAMMPSLYRACAQPPLPQQKRYWGFPSIAAPAMPPTLG